MSANKKIRLYTSEDIDVTYDASLCIHAAKCVRGLPDVFDTKKRPWVQPGNAPAADIAEVVKRCPTGALQFTRKDGGADEGPPPRNLIRVKKNGPLYVHDNLRIVNDQGETVFTGTRVALCRCGASSNRPFCDNSHRRIVFEDPGQFTGNDQTSLAETEYEPLEIQPQTNRSYRIEGSLEIASHDGQVVYRGSKVFLCRCGASNSKPFCDSNHRQINFQSD